MNIKIDLYVYINMKWDMNVYGTYTLMVKYVVTVESTWFLLF